MHKYLRHKKFSILRRNEVTDYIKQTGYVTWTELIYVLGMKKKTLQRVLDGVQLVTSLNSKRGYFTLRSIVQERRDPESKILWKIDGRVFSLVGNLRDTVSHLIRYAPSGIDEKTLTEMLGTPTRNILAQLKKECKAKCHSFEGRTVYFSSDTRRYSKQLPRRLCHEDCNEIQISFEKFLQTLGPEIQHIAKEVVPTQIRGKTDINYKELIKLILVEPKVAHCSDRHMSRLLRNDKQMKQLIRTGFTGHSAISKYKDLLTVEFYVRMFEYLVERLIKISGIKKVTILTDCTVNGRYKRDNLHFRCHTAIIAELKCPIAMIVTKGQVHESPVFERILSKLEKLKVRIKYVICDAGYDCGTIFVRIAKRLKAIAVIPTRNLKKNSVIDYETFQLTLDYYFEDVYGNEIIDLVNAKKESDAGEIIREIVNNVKSLEWWKELYKIRTGIERFFGWAKMFLGLTKPNGYSLKQVTKHAYQIFSYTVAQAICAIKLGIETKIASYRSFVV